LEKVKPKNSRATGESPCHTPGNKHGCPAACAAVQRPADYSRLTAAERRVLALVSLAKTNKEIAATLCISPATVKRHIENLLRKLELRNRVEAAIYGLMVAGCPHGLDAECPLEMWHKERGLPHQNWAV
jgi:DNA-binding CsgD family transcriptional regulator